MPEKRRNELLKDGLLLLITGTSKFDPKPHASFGAYDDYMIAEAERFVMRQTMTLPTKLRTALHKIVKEFESNPECVVGNGTFNHALAVELWNAYRDATEPADVEYVA